MTEPALAEPTATEPPRPGAPRSDGTRPALPGPPIHPIRRAIRYGLARGAVQLLVRAVVRIRVHGRHELPDGPVLYCANHQNWADPFVLMAALPWRPRLYFFGPQEEDMGVGGRNRLMLWTGTAVPYKPGKNDLLEATRRVQLVFAAGGSMAIFAEGRIHAGEGELLPLSEGAAYFALRSGVPIVPVAINGTSWLTFGRRIRVRIGRPIQADGRPNRETVDALTRRTTEELRILVADYPDPPVPGRIGRWLTELFNDWPEGGRPETGSGAEGASGILEDRPRTEET
jgi:1-acyl-sn-glycerol-3-phosphate acyltransferase